MTGALVVGRKLFDFTDGWDGNHPLGKPVVVLTHSVPDGWPRDDAPFTFVSEGIERAVAVARELLAGEKVVGVNGGTIARSVPRRGAARRDLGRPRAGPAGRRHAVLRGSSRPLPVELEGPVSVEQGPRRHAPALPRAQGLITSVQDTAPARP